MTSKERYGEELEGGALVIDVPEESGVELIIPMDETGMNCTNLRVFFHDDEAQELIDIIQNKINARLII